MIFIATLLAASATSYEGTMQEGTKFAGFSLPLLQPRKPGQTLLRGNKNLYERKELRGGQDDAARWLPSAMMSAKKEIGAPCNEKKGEKRGEEVEYMTPSGQAVYSIPNNSSGRPLLKLVMLGRDDDYERVFGSNKKDLSTAHDL